MFGIIIHCIHDDLKGKKSLYSDKWSEIDNNIRKENKGDHNLQMRTYAHV